MSSRSFTQIIRTIQTTDASTDAAIVVERLQGLLLTIAKAGAYDIVMTPKKYLESYDVWSHDILRQVTEIFRYHVAKTLYPSALCLLLRPFIIPMIDAIWQSEVGARKNPWRMLKIQVVLVCCISISFFICVFSEANDSLSIYPVFHQ